MSFSKTERILYASYLAKLGFRQRIVTQSSLITSSQCRKLFDDLANDGYPVMKRSGPCNSAGSLIRTRSDIWEASLLMLCYTRILPTDVYLNYVDMFAYISAVREYRQIRTSRFARTEAPFDISDGYILAESLRNPDSDTGGLMMSCSTCHKDYYNAVDQRIRNTKCPFCNNFAIAPKAA